MSVCRPPFIQVNGTAVVADIKTNGKSKNYRVVNKDEANRLLNEARPHLQEQPTYKDQPYKAGYEHHPNESHTKNAPHNNLPHIKWKDWSGGRKKGGSGHIFYD